MAIWRRRETCTSVPLRTFLRQKCASPWLRMLVFLFLAHGVVFLQEKRLWRRYMYLWIYYAVFEELEAKVCLRQSVYS